MTPMQSPPGLQLGRLSDWMDSALPGLREGALAAQPISGGFSNLTYRISDGVSTWVLRRPPLGHVLPSAHDIGPRVSHHQRAGADGRTGADTSRLLR